MCALDSKTINNSAMNILATVETVATNIIAKIAVAKSRHSKHFQFKVKLKQNVN